MSIPPYGGSASGSLYAPSSSSSRSASPSGAGPSDEPDREAAGGSPAPLSGRASPLESIQHVAASLEETRRLAFTRGLITGGLAQLEDVLATREWQAWAPAPEIALVRDLVQDGLAELAAAFIVHQPWESLAPEYVQDLAGELVNELLVRFHSKSEAELRSLVELERAIAAQEILRKRMPLKTYVQECLPHFENAKCEALRSWQPSGSSNPFAGLREALNDQPIIERVTAAVTESGRSVALDYGVQPDAAHPLDAEALANVSEQARRVLTTYSDLLNRFLGIWVQTHDPEAPEEAPEDERMLRVWIALNNPNRDAIKGAFEAQAHSLLSGCTERDLELIWSSEHSPLYREWMQTTLSVIGHFARLYV